MPGTPVHAEIGERPQFPALRPSHGGGTGGYTGHVAARTTLTAADIDALVNARHPAPRSLLGYHEFPRRNGDDPVCMVRVLEPDAVSVRVRWEPEGTPGFELKRVHETGLFEGRVPYRRPVDPYRLHVRYRNGAGVEKHDA